MEKTVEDAQKRYKEISDLVEGDETGEKFLNDLVNSVHRYVDNVTNMQAFLKGNSRDSRLQGSSYESEKHLEKIQELDELRKSSHNNLISRLNMFNRYLLNQYPGETPQGGIYTLSPQSIKDRKAVGSWAGYLFKALSTTNKPSNEDNLSENVLSSSNVYQETGR